MSQLQTTNFFPEERIKVIDSKTFNCIPHLVAEAVVEAAVKSVSLEIQIFFKAKFGCIKKLYVNFFVNFLDFCLLLGFYKLFSF